MSTNPFAPKPETLADYLPIFPLAGVLLLPWGHLPLNIFEPRYLTMVEDAMAQGRLIGMVQPLPEQGHLSPKIYSVGCAGKIIDFNETIDGRYFITLCGFARFEILEETSLKNGYRRVRPRWIDYNHDIAEKPIKGLCRDKLKTLLKQYFVHEGMNCDWDAIDQAPTGKLITCLAMTCPFDPAEKQALLEAEDEKQRFKMFMTMLEMAVCMGEKENANKSKH